MNLSSATKNSPATDETGHHTENEAPDMAIHHLNKNTAQKARFRVSDNPLHQRLFSLPLIAPTTSTALAVPTLPKKQRVTGDREIDAVLWLREVIGTGDAVLIAHAKEAAAKINTPLHMVEKRYIEHLRLEHPDNPFAGLSSIGFAELDKLAERSIERRSRQVEALGRFGSEEALFDPTAAESFCIVTLKGLEPQGPTHAIDPEQATTRFRQHPAELPHTLADCLHELQYWDQLATLRYAFGTCYGDPLKEVQAREDFVFGRLSEIPPRDNVEARRVLDYLYLSNFMDRTATRAILTNLIG